MANKAELGTLTRADGSASFSANGYSVIAGVNGPVEVQRRDELPEEATLEVNIRPAIGLSGIRERHFESIIHKALKTIVKTDAFPRTLIQITLQVTSIPENDINTSRPPQAASNLSILPPLLNAACLALLSTSLPLETTLASAVIGVLQDGSIVRNPDSRAIPQALSLHVLAFTGQGKLLVVESEGSFDMKQWQSVAKEARDACQRLTKSKEPANEDGIVREDSASVMDTFRQAVHDKLAKDFKWKQSVK